MVRQVTLMQRLLKDSYPFGSPSSCYLLCSSATVHRHRASPIPNIHRTLIMRVFNSLSALIAVATLSQGQGLFPQGELDLCHG